MLSSKYILVLLFLAVAVSGQEVPPAPLAPARTEDNTPLPPPAPLTPVVDPSAPQAVPAPVPGTEPVGVGGVLPGGLDSTPQLPGPGPGPGPVDTNSGRDGTSGSDTSGSDSGLTIPPPIAIPDESPQSHTPPPPPPARGSDSASNDNDSSHGNPPPPPPSPPHQDNEDREEEAEVKAGPESREDESSSSDITTDACSEAMTSICKLGSSYTFEESLRCLESHVNELQGACSGALNVMMSNLYTDCGAAVSTLCENSASSSSGGDESVYVLTCLSNHESELSADCQQQLDTYLNEEYPCAKEATLFCSQPSHTKTPEHTLSCLETIASTSPEEISLQCATVLDGFSSCKDAPEEGDGRDDSRGKPGPKPKPRASTRRALIATEDDLASGISILARDDKSKPKPKPKPGPGGERRCWQGQEGRRDGSFLGNLGDLGGHGTSTADSSDDDSHPTGLVMSSLVVVLALVGVVGVKYRQSQEEVDSRGGYWRAPSIQAMLFDDSGHSHEDGNDSFGIRGGGLGSIKMAKAVEMDELQTAIPVTVSPIAHADEIRV